MRLQTLIAYGNIKLVS